MTISTSRYLVLISVATIALAQSPQFEVASVKVSTSSVRGNMRGGPGTSDPLQLTMTNVTLFQVIVRAYDIKAYQVNAPDWISSRKFDIAAKVPPAATKLECNAMLQKLLADRFHLSLHRETKELSGYELVAGKGGSKLAPARPVTQEPAAAGTDSTPPSVDANGFPQISHAGIVMMEGARGKAVVAFLTARAQPVSSLVELLSKEFRVPIADRTGLAGEFDFRLEYAPEPPGALPPASVEVSPDVDPSSAPNLMTAVQQQLGLKLNPGKVAVNLLIVDRADQIPTEN